MTISQDLKIFAENMIDLIQPLSISKQTQLSIIGFIRIS